MKKNEDNVNGSNPDRKSQIIWDKAKRVLSHTQRVIIRPSVTLLPSHVQNHKNEKKFQVMWWNPRINIENIYNNTTHPASIREI